MFQHDSAYLERCRQMSAQKACDADNPTIAPTYFASTVKYADGLAAKSAQSLGN